MENPLVSIRTVVGSPCSVQTISGILVRHGNNWNVLRIYTLADTAATLPGLLVVAEAFIDNSQCSGICGSGIRAYLGADYAGRA
jgi:hypothetical protein